MQDAFFIFKLCYIKAFNNLQRKVHDAAGVNLKVGGETYLSSIR